MTWIRDSKNSKDGVVIGIFHGRRKFGRVLRACRVLLLLQPLQWEVEAFHSKIGVQEAIFEECCRSILYISTENQQDIDDMFKNLDHPMWVKATMEQRLGRVMGRYYDYSVKVLLHIQEVMDNLHKQLQRVAKAEEYQKCILSWARISPVRPEKLLGRSLHNLQEYNDFFSTLVGQAVLKKADLFRPPSSSGRILECGCFVPHTEESDHQFCCVQQASEDLYKALCAWSYHNTSAHLFYICLHIDEPPITRPCKGLESDIILTTSPLNEPFQFLVQSRVVRERLFSWDSPDSTEERKLGRQSWSCLSIPQRGKSAFTRVEPSKKIPYDLKSMQNLYLHLENSVYSSNTLKGDTMTSLLGFLKGWESLSYFWFCIPEYYRRDQASYSLDEFFKKAKDSQTIIPIEHKLWMAKVLARDLLYLHATSWVSQEWGSKDIRFFECDGSDTQRILKRRPFIRMQVARCIDQESVPEITASEKTTQVLYRLGLVLLELAFEASWYDLQPHNDVMKDICTTDRENLTIAQLSQKVSKELGSRYAKVVRHCLGHGISHRELHGFEKPQTCQVIFNEIVRELDYCLLAVSDKNGRMLQISLSTTYAN